MWEEGDGEYQMLARTGKGVVRYSLRKVSLSTINLWESLLIERMYQTHELWVPPVSEVVSCSRLWAVYRPVR